MKPGYLDMAAEKHTSYWNKKNFGNKLKELTALTQNFE